MPIPFESARNGETPGVIGFLRFVDEGQGKGIRAALFATSALQLPLEFCFHPRRSRRFRAVGGGTSAQGGRSVLDSRAVPVRKPYSRMSSWGWPTRSHPWFFPRKSVSKSRYAVSPLTLLRGEERRRRLNNSNHPCSWCGAPLHPARVLLLDGC